MPLAVILWWWQPWKSTRGDMDAIGSLHLFAWLSCYHATDQVRQHKADSATQRKLWHLAWQCWCLLLSDDLLPTTLTFTGSFISVYFFSLLMLAIALWMFSPIILLWKQDFANNFCWSKKIKECQKDKHQAFWEWSVWSFPSVALRSRSVLVIKWDPDKWPKELRSFTTQADSPSCL